MPIWDARGLELGRDAICRSPGLGMTLARFAHLARSQNGARTPALASRFRTHGLPLARIEHAVASGGCLIRLNMATPGCGSLHHDWMKLSDFATGLQCSFVGTGARIWGTYTHASPNNQKNSKPAKHKITINTIHQVRERLLQEPLKQQAAERQAGGWENEQIGAGQFGSLAQAFHAQSMKNKLKHWL